MSENTLQNISKTYVYGYEVKIENAIRNYNPKQMKSYLQLVKSKEALIEEFSMIHNIETNVSGSYLEQEGLESVIKLANELKNKNIINSFKLI